MLSLLYPASTVTLLPCCCRRITGADISALCREAAMSALEEDLGAAAVAARHFNLALLRVQPSSSPSSDTMAMYDQFQRHTGLAVA